MNKLGAAVSCFALSAVFAWISSSSTASALNARSHATSYGLALMLKQPPQDNGIAGFTLFAAFAMLLIGAGCLIAAMFPRKRRLSE
jgi:hypothetical protein